MILTISLCGVAIGLQLLKDVSIALTLLAKLRINASDREAEKAGYLNAIYNISLNQGLAKYREQLKEFLTELSKLCQSKDLSCFSGHS